MQQLRASMERTLLWNFLCQRTAASASVSMRALQTAAPTKKTALIYRSTSVNGPYEKVKELPFKKSWQLWDATYAAHFTDKTVIGDATYYYKLKVRKTIGKKVSYSKFSEPKAVRTQPDWTMYELTYSNLTDEKTRQEISGILRKAGIRQNYMRN